MRCAAPNPTTASPAAFSRKRRHPHWPFCSLNASPRSYQINGGWMTAASTPPPFVGRIASTGVKCVTGQRDLLRCGPWPQVWTYASTICMRRFLVIEAEQLFARHHHPSSADRQISNRCGAWHYYHDPTWLYPTARRATYDNGRQSCLAVLAGTTSWLLSPKRGSMKRPGPAIAGTTVALETAARARRPIVIVRR